MAFYTQPSDHPAVHGPTHEFIVGGNILAMINERLDGTLYAVDHRSEVYELGSSLASAMRREIVDAIARHRDELQVMERWLEEHDNQ